MPELLTRDSRQVVAPGGVDAYGAAAVADAIETAILCGSVVRWAPPRPRRTGRLRTAAHVLVALLLCTVAAAGLTRLAGTRSPHADATEATEGTAGLAVPAAVPIEPAELPGPKVLPTGFSAWSATPVGPVTARALPDPQAPAVASFGTTNDLGGPQTFGVLSQTWGTDGAAWVEVQLAVRPNGTTGWIPASALTISGAPMRIQVHLSTGELVLLEHGTETGRWPVAIGPDRYPTPPGTYYAWTKYYDGPPAAYGPGVLGLSGFSEVLDSSNWPGDARIGIHGAATEESLGGRAGHGCVRMRNADIAFLLGHIPLGTPVDVLP